MPKRKKNYKCLMIETKGKKYFTDTKNYPKLVEFSKTLKANISIVKVDDAEILPLKDLAPAICSNMTFRKADFKIIKNKIKTKNRKESIRLATEIREEIKTMFLEGLVVSVKGLVLKYKKHDLTSSCFYNHIKCAIKSLDEPVKKIDVGSYMLVRFT